MMADALLRWFHACDRGLLLCWLTLLCFGVVMVASASLDYAEHNYGRPAFFLARHGVYLAIALLSAGVFCAIPLAVWRWAGPYLLVLSIFLLLAVFVPGVGREVNGSARWLSLGGLSVQPSELAKLATVLYLAGFLVRRHKNLRTQALTVLAPAVLLSVILLLLLLEPDFGTSLVLVATAGIMFFLGGLKWRAVFVLAALASTAAVLLTFAAPYRWQRLVTYLDPWGDPLGSGYQLSQALIAFGRGQWLGQGLGDSVQKQLYLPEVHTDFVFAVVGEELGLLGVVLLVALFVFLIGRMWMIAGAARRRGDHFSAFAVYGAATLLCLQSTVNMGVNTGLLPTKGFPLPFISYGGSSLVASCLLVALALRAAYENHRGTIRE